MDAIKKQWLDFIGSPENYDYEKSMKLVKKYSFKDFDGELYIQANGPDRYQRLFVAIPRGLTGPAPAVTVPYYYPEATLGFTLDDEKEIPFDWDVYIVAHLAKRGYIAATAEAYYRTYVPDSKLSLKGFEIWQEAGNALNADHPEWSGMGKLIEDAKLVTDFLENDPRVDSSRIGIAGHSLGGKMALYAGCLDDRYKVILANDPGLCWEQTNWQDDWYWGKKLEDIKAAGLDHASLLGVSGGKPFCLIAGEYDNDESFELMKRAPGYSENDEKLMFINHGSGHCPPQDVLDEAYDFIDKWLK